jgi:hypothetical protein
MLSQAVRAAAAAEPILKCPVCRAKIDFSSVERELGAAQQVVPKTWGKQLVEELPRIGQRIRKQMPLVPLLGPALITGVIAIGIITNLIQEPAGIAVQMLLKSLVPSFIGGVIGAAMGLIFVETIVSLGRKLIEQTNLRPNLQDILHMALVLGTLVLALKVAALVAPILAASSLKLPFYSLHLETAELQMKVLEAGIATGAGFMAFWVQMRKNFAWMISRMEAGRE